MKTKLSTLSIIAVLLGFILLGCNSKSTKKVEEAKENLSIAATNLKEAEQIEQRVLNDSLTAGYESFEKSMKDKIDKNEKSFIELKNKAKKEEAAVKSASNAYILQLEQKNMALRKKLNEYKVQGKDKEDTFKKEFKHDADELEQALKDLFAKNVK